MDRLDWAAIAVAVVGVALLLTTPPEPTYGVEVGAAPDATPEEVTPFADLDEAGQEIFLDALADGEWSGKRDPGIPGEFVRYEGTLYRVSLAVSETSVVGLLRPAVSGGLAALGGLVLVARRLRWRLSDRRPASRD